MPTYVYACDACGSQFEQFQRFQDEPLKVCPCGKEGAVRRVFQPVGIVFKGTGWYITDSRKSAAADGDSKTASVPAATTSDTAKPATDKPATDKPAESTPKPEPAKPEAAKPALASVTE